MKRIKKLYYRISISVIRDGVKYNTFVIGNDKNLQVLFHYHCQFSEVRIPKQLAKLVDVGVEKPDAVEDVLRDDDNVQAATIVDDSNDDIGRSISVGPGGASSSGIQ
ncbi:hypothetical protein Ahy_A09g045252 [Arachis hypogaea]|uniref:Uncharacterized protein n=1 Tax=Arachis hypogaea TaxID=3818 RepID=A0A445BLX7_ARAHY|nr:hypothetical protein Ahy_A09g045252 [Arachis hypogaea]